MEDVSSLNILHIDTYNFFSEILNNLPDAFTYLQSTIRNKLKSYKVNVDVVDPYADSAEVLKEYGFELSENINNSYDAVILAVSHTEYLELSEEYFENILNKDGIIVDIKGIYRNVIKNVEYWSL